MQPKGPPKDARKLAQIRLFKEVLLPLQIIALLAVAAFLVTNAGIRSTPPYVPLLAALPLLVIAIAVLSLQLIAFRFLEIRHAPREGQKYILVDISWRNAKKAFAIALLLAVLLLVPPVKALTLNLLSPTSQRGLEAGGIFPLTFNSEDALGISHAESLQVVVQSGSLRVQIQEGTGPPSRNVTLGAGEQRTFGLTATGFVPYTVTFENLVGTTTSFTYKVNLALPTGFINLAALLMAVVAVSNLAWLVYLRPLREAGLKAMPSAMRRRRPAKKPRSVPGWPPRQPAYGRRPVAWRWPWQSGQAPRYPVPRGWNPAYGPYPTYARAPYARPRPRPNPRPAPPLPQPAVEGEPEPSPEPEVRALPEEDLPPPPDQVEPYQVEGSPPPLVEPIKDPDRAALRSAGTDIAGLLDKAEDRMAMGEFQEALRDYETILRVDSRNLPALLKMAELLQRVHRPSDALDALNRVLEIDPFHQQALLEKADLLEAENRHDDALECYETILQGSPSVLMALMRKGDLMARLGEPELAWEAYSEAQRLAPDHAELQEKIRSLEEGQGVTMDPESPEFLLKKARAAARAGSLEEALRLCEEAAELASDSPEAWALKGVLEQDLHQQGPAIASLRRAVELEPTDHVSARRLEGLQRKAQDQIDLEKTLREIDGLDPGAVTAIAEKFRNLRELKRAKLRSLAAIEGVEEAHAKAILRRVRSGR
ncbi:MAG: tetratricopeptide repeat protein [Thermoplasmata archaeon]